MKILKFILLTLFVFFAKLDTASALMTVHPLESPNKEYKLEILIGPLDQTSFHVFHKGQKILYCSSLGFLLENGEPTPTPFISGDYVDKIRKSEQGFGALFKKQAREIRVPDPDPKYVLNEVLGDYNEVNVEYVGVMKIVFRAYNDGVAFRYEFKTGENETISLKEELTEFSFPYDYPVIGEHENVPVTKIDKSRECPITVHFAHEKTVSISETELGDFAPMRLQGVSEYEKHSALKVQWSEPVTIRGTGKPFCTPWRRISITDNSAPIRQMLRVRVPDASKSEASVSGYALDESTGKWIEELPEMLAQIGAQGLAPDGKKKEGDKKTPTGQFSLSLAFGREPKGPDGMKIPYKQATENDFWIDDPASPQYNRWFTGEKPNCSHERLHLADNVPVYDLAAVIEYNTDPIVPGAGSAIFLHIWLGEEIPTSGCVSLSEENVRKILLWLDPEKNPHIRTTQKPETD